MRAAVASAPMSGGRCGLSMVIWVLILWILLLHAFTGLWPPSSFSGSSSSSSKGLDPVTGLLGLVQYRELEEVEEIPVFQTATLTRPLRPTKRKKGAQRRKTSSDDPVSELPLEKRLFYFPDPNAAAVDPLSKNNADERYYFYPGREWRDSDGRPIQAHGGAILYVPETGTFYWYGENKDGPTYRLTKRSSARVDSIGISCYSSKDLWLWKHEGIVLASDKSNNSSDLHVNNVLERPKVVYNERSKQYVMWVHVDNANYSKAAVGVAVSSRPDGRFDYLGSMRPHGFDSRDMTVFKDEEDGVAYLIYSSVGNTELHISPLSGDYLGLKNVMSRVLVNHHREAPAVFKHRGLFYMITSGCTGWSPNPALVHSAESMLGPWETLGDPCVGASEEFRSTTFYSQGAFVLPLPGLQDMFVFVADRWNPGDLRDSRYVWLPLTMDGPPDEPEEDNFDFPIWSRVSIRWHRKWKLPQGINLSQQQHEQQQQH